jgi:electron transfer flavoprotein alpha subunit
MTSGVCVFVDTEGGNIDPTVRELLSAALWISRVTKEKTQAIVISEDLSGITKELKSLPFEQIFAVETRKIPLFGDDAKSEVVAEMLRRIKPSCVLIPASDSGRSVFSRVAVKLDTGLSADCTELAVGRDENGRFFIKQNKPSFGENVIVSIVNKAGRFPQMATLRQGMFERCDESPQNVPVVTAWDDIPIPESGISLSGTLARPEPATGVMSSDIVIVAGRGALEGEDLDLLRKFAQNIGASLGCTRPVADAGIISFENQIGQTGCAIKPSICLSFGVSGAIQHVEGIRNPELFIAVNRDPGASIFNVSDYGVVSEMREILKKLVEKTASKN